RRTGQYLGSENLRRQPGPSRQQCKVEAVSLDLGNAGGSMGQRNRQGRTCRHRLEIAGRIPDDPLNNRRWRDTLTLTDGSDARAPAFQLVGQRWPRQTFHGHLRQDVVACRRSSASPTRAWLEPELLGEVGSGQREASVFQGPPGPVMIRAAAVR